MTRERPDISLTIRESGGTQYTVALSGDKACYRLGRRDRHIAAVVDVALNDKHISRKHCELAWDPGHRAWTVRDLKSANGTTLDGAALNDEPVPLDEGAQIKLGATLVTVGFGNLPDATIAPGGHGTAEDDDDGGATRMISRHDGADATVMTGTDATVMAGSALESEATVLGDAGLTTLESEATVLGGAGLTALEPEATVLGAAAPYTVSHQTAASQTAASQTAASQTLIPQAAATTHSVRSRATRRGADSARPAAGAPARDPDISLAGIAGDLIQANLIDESKAVSLCKLARETGRTFFRALAADGTVKFHDEIYALVARDFDLERIETEKQLMELAVPTPWLSFARASGLGAVMLSSASGDGAYATIDPFDLALHDWIVRCIGRPAQRHLVTPQIFQSALQRLKNRGDEDESGANVLVIEITQEEEKRISTQTGNIDVPQVVNYFLQRAFLQGASDIHIEPTEDFLLVRNRVDGILHEDTTLPVELHPEIASRIKILSGMDVAEKRRPQDGRIGTVIRSNPIDVRVSSFPTIYGEKIVMRLLDKNALRPSPEHLGVMARDLRLLYDKLDAPFGLVMISGPTGSGKTTTLYSCLGYIDKKTKNVLTVEDPVEYRLKGVHQMQVNDKIGLTFASGLRTILRQDPDVIMVGECRDAETAGMAIQAALTGHIVFSTIHTNDAVGVITRMLDMGIDHFLVANALSLCIAQRLVRRVCKHCQTTVDGNEVLRRLRNDGISDERLEALRIEVDPYLTYITGVGCVHCRNTGYQGRQAVFEVFEMTNEARATIMAPNFNADDLRRRARDTGMTTLIGHGLAMIEEGITTHAEVIRVLGESY